MKVIDFEITLEINGKAIEASCQKFHVYKYTQIRVVVGKAFNERVYTFYEINLPKQKYFWYPLPDSRKEKEAKAIVKGLIKSNKAKESID